ncbi:hypothetical protein VKT23_018990 [Stygiomarasmius scandens]|uniref:Xylanolytic transcriptional activator regulatory domain-containing protein n=1 Tax=Marasmiellus scandens TaxID=2682957 RepID=A0ABR1IRR7_9AGAR
MSVSSQSSTGTMPVAPALMYSMFLLASHLSASSPQVSALEPEFLSRAVGSVSQILTSTSQRTETRTSDHPHWKVLQAIQSHVLLAQYFFLTGRKLEGRYSVTIAVSLVLGTRMHRIRSEEEALQSFGMHRETGRGIHTGGYTSGSGAQVVNPREETERINAFWTVLALNSRWTAIEGNARSSSTIQRFLANTPDDGHSTLALHAKACILLEQAFDLVNRYDQSQPSSATGSSQSAQNFLGAFNSLIGLTTRFTSELPPVDSVPDSPPSTTSSFPRALNSGSKKRQLLVIHTLVRVAAIRLYSLFENTNYSGPNERVRTHQLKLEAANEAARMIGLIDGRGVVFIDSVMAMLWPVIAHVLITEIRRLGGRGGHTQVEYQGSFDLISRAMSGLAPCSTLMSEQLGKMQGSRSM